MSTTINQYKRKAEEELEPERPCKRVKFGTDMLLNMLPELVNEVFSWLAMADLMMARIAFYKHPTVKTKIEEQYRKRDPEDEEAFWSVIYDADNDVHNVNKFEYVYLFGVTTNNVQLMKEVFGYIDPKEVNVFQMYMYAVCGGHLQAFHQINEHFGTDLIEAQEQTIWGAIATSPIGVECFDVFWKAGVLYVHMDWLNMEEWVFSLSGLDAEYYADKYRYDCLMDHLRKERILELLLLELPDAYLYYDRDLLPHLQQYPVPPLSEL